MEIPDFLGLRLCEAITLLKETYPELIPVIVQYDPPVSKNYSEKSAQDQRIIRQRVLDSKKLELVVAAFNCCPHD
jgi:hypothetical protein